jgi:hypothetical protein
MRASSARLSAFHVHNIADAILLEACLASDILLGLVSCAMEPMFPRLLLIDRNLVRCDNYRALSIFVITD